MNNDKIYLNLIIEGDEVKKFLKSKESVGIKSNTDFIRYMIKTFKVLEVSK